MGTSSGSGMSRREFLRRVAAGAIVAAEASGGRGSASDGGSAPSAPGSRRVPDAARLPRGVKAVWDMDKADQEATPTRARVCINGLWRWQPAREASDTIPTAPHALRTSSHGRNRSVSGRRASAHVVLAPATARDGIGSQLESELAHHAHDRQLASTTRRALPRSAEPVQ